MVGNTKLWYFRIDETFWDQLEDSVSNSFLEKKDFLGRSDFKGKNLAEQFGLLASIFIFP